MRNDRLKPLHVGMLAGAAFASLMASSAMAANVNFVSGAVGRDIEVLRELVKPWEAETGNTVTVVPMPSSTSSRMNSPSATPASCVGSIARERIFHGCPDPTR